MSEGRENLIGYCGLYCGDCFNYKGEIADLSRDLRKKLKYGSVRVVNQRKLFSKTVMAETDGAI